MAGLDDIDVRELNSAIAELNRMLISLGPALFEMRDATLGGAKEMSRLRDATSQTADTLGTSSKKTKESTEAKEKLTEEERKALRDKQVERQKAREREQVLQQHRKSVQQATNDVQQGQRAQRDLTAAFRGFGNNILADIALGVQRFSHSKTLIAAEEQKIAQIAAEAAFAAEDAQVAQEALQAKQAEIAANKQKLNDATAELAANKEKQAATKQVLDALKSQIKQKQEERLATQHMIEAKKQEAAYIQSQLSAAQGQKSAVEARIKALKDEQADIRAQIASGKATPEQMRGLQSRLQETSNQLVQANMQRLSLIESEGRMQSELDATTASQREYQQQADNLTGEISSLIPQANAAATEMAGLGRAVNASESQMDAALQTQENLESELDGLSQTAQAAQDRLGNLGDSAEDAAANLRNMKIERMSAALSGPINGLNKIGGILASLGNGLRDFERRVGISAMQLGKMAFTEPTKAINIVKGKWQEMIGARGQDYFDRMIEARDAFGDEFGGTLTGAAAGKLAAQARSMGVTVGELAKARRGFMTLSMGDLKGATEAQGKFVAEFKKKGLNTKDAFEAVSKYSDIMARNGGRFAASFAKAAADAKKIGVDLKKVDAFGDSIISDYEGFLEKQSELGAMGFNFDSSKMAQVAESGDTGALMNELRSQLAAQGKDLTKMRRSEQLALSNAFGIPMEELLRLSQPKPEEGSREDRQSASGEKTAMHAERIDKATLNQNTKLTAIGMLLQKLAAGLAIIAPAVVGLATWRSGKKTADLAKSIQAMAGKSGPGTAAAEAASAKKPGLLSRMFGRGAAPTETAVPPTPTPTAGAPGRMPLPGAAAGQAGPMPKAAGQLNPSLGGKMADFGKGLAGLGKGAGQAVAGFMKGLASGIAAFANPAVVAGAAVLIGTVAVGIIAIGGALSLAALMLGKTLPVLAKGLTSFNEIDGGNLAKVGLGLLAASVGLAGFGAAMITMGLASPVILAGSAALAVASGVLLGMAKVASVVLPDFTKALAGFNEIDGFNLAKVGLSLLPLSLGIFALGPALASLGLGTMVDKIANMFSDDKGGIAGVVEKIKEFEKFKLNPTAIKGNADSIAAFANGMNSLRKLGGGWFSDDISVILAKVGKADLTPVLTSMRKFAEEKVGNPSTLKAKAEAFTAFGGAMKAIADVAAGGWFTDDLGTRLAKWPPVATFNGVFESYTSFSKQEVGKADQLKSKAEAFLAFGQAIEAIATIATGGWLSADLGKKLAKWPPAANFKPLYDSYIDFSKQEVGKADELKNKADAFKAYGEAIKTVADIASGGWFKDDLSEKIATWAAVDVKPLYTKFEEFSKLPVGDAAAIEGKAKGLAAFSEAMSSVKEIPLIDPAAMTNITTGFTNFITATTNAVPTKITATATGLNALSEAFGKYANGPITQAEKITKNFNTALDTLGNALTKVGTALASIQTSKIDKIKDAFSPQFTAAFTASIMALANIYEGKKVDAGAITKGRDVVSNSGYGERTLVTPSGPIALHNSDTVVAYANDMIANDGVRLLSKGALLNNQPQASTPVNVSVDMGRLEQKLDAVVRAIGSMNVQMDGAKVGKVLVNAAEAGGQVGVFGLQSRATL